MRYALMKLDPLLLISTMLLLAFGLVVMASASAEISYQSHQQPLYYFFRQLVFIAVATGLMLVLAHTPLSLLSRSRWLSLLIALTLLALVLVPGIGHSVNGSQRWIDIGIVRFHASDFARTFLLIFCAAWLASRAAGMTRAGWSELWPMAILLAIVWLLILLQPDFGAAAVITASLFGMMFLGGMRLIPMIATAGIGLGLMTGLLLSAPYRLRRLQSFWNPFDDRYGSGFQQAQSLIAIGSGGTDGVGLGNSVQKMSFLPESHNDFIFSILAEEFGFIGIVFVVSLYLLLIVRMLILSARARWHGAHFASFICAGVGIWLSVQSLINIGVATSLLPAKGISLPLVSYGGSNMVVSLIQIGLVLAAAREMSTPRAKPIQS